MSMTTGFIMARRFVFFVCATLAPAFPAFSQPERDFPFYRLDEKNSVKMTARSASHFAMLALNCIQREYPNKSWRAASDSLPDPLPRQMHPAFYGCFDWHSSVHSHWMLVRILKLFPNLPQADTIRQRIRQNITRENIAGECAFFNRPANESFERMYGWAWLLKLSEELYDWDDPDAKSWRERLQPLTDIIVERYKTHLPRQSYSNNTGVHSNTAFALSFAYDYAVKAGEESLERLIVERSKKYYLDDADCPAHWEPAGEDFISPCLMEAELMSKILPRRQFEKWFDRFMPGLEEGDQNLLIYPAEATDRSDERFVHLDGLNLSRAWCMMQIAKSLGAGHPVRNLLYNAAHRHLQTALPHVASGRYAGEHWLASFAIYALSFDY